VRARHRKEKEARGIRRFRERHLHRSLQLFAGERDPDLPDAHEQREEDHVLRRAERHSLFDHERRRAAFDVKVQRGRARRDELLRVASASRAVAEVIAAKPR
jgi:hypothetical protein